MLFVVLDFKRTIKCAVTVLRLATHGKAACSETIMDLCGLCDVFFVCEVENGHDLFSIGHKSLGHKVGRELIPLARHLRRPPPPLYKCYYGYRGVEGKGSNG
jgi:hypothetical protein